MKPNRFLPGTVMIPLLLVLPTAFWLAFNSPVKGSVDPSNAALRAWLFSKTDTLNSPVAAGNFRIDNVKPGTYTLMVEGRPPYRNSIKEGVVVVEGQPSDVGVITMSQ
jgi:hypothetical protein